MNSELPNKIIRLMSAFISDRTIAVKINDEMSDKVKLNAGTPRGSVLRPLMNNQVKISQFADDLGMWTFGPNSRADTQRYCAINDKSMKLLTHVLDTLTFLFRHGGILY